MSTLAAFAGHQCGVHGAGTDADTNTDRQYGRHAAHCQHHVRHTAGHFGEHDTGPATGAGRPAGHQHAEHGCTSANRRLATAAGHVTDYADTDHDRTR